MNGWTLIIGGNSGIGQAIWEADWKNSKFPDSTTWLRPAINELDVRDVNTITHYINTIDLPITRVVYSAGYNEPAILGTLAHVDTLEAFGVNVIGFIHLLNSLVRFQGHVNEDVSILAIVSDAASVAMRGSISYCSSKAALSHAIRCAARELAAYGWRVNGIAPGIVADTPMTDKIDQIIPAMRGWSRDEARVYEESLIPMRRRATKAEVAELALSVLDGPKYLTGAIIPITGGK